MSEETAPVPETDATGQLAEALATATRATLAALLALILVLLTLLVRAMQAAFILARPAVLAGTVAAAGYASITLFVTVLDHYGNDLPAAMLALTAVVITPTALIVLKSDSGTWAVMLATAVIDLLARAGIERAPPVVVAALPAIGLAAVTLYHLRAIHDPPQGQQAKGESENGKQQERNGNLDLDHDDSPRDLQCDV